MSRPRARRTFRIPIGLRQVSVTRRVDTCDPGRERESEERGTPTLPRSAARPVPKKRTIPPRSARQLCGGKSPRLVLFACMRPRGSSRRTALPLKIGSRALDILITLLEHAPEVVSKRDLIRRVWGQLVVDEVSLRVHVAALRKRLGDGDSSVSYITNIPGRGYCFAGAVTWAEARGDAEKGPHGCAAAASGALAHGGTRQCGS